MSEATVEQEVSGNDVTLHEVGSSRGGACIIIDASDDASSRSPISMEEQIKRAKNIYSGEAVTQVVNIFQKYDVNQNGVIELSELPRMCTDLGIKPWQALKELSTTSDGQIELREFISWWFSPRTEHTRQEESYVHSIFDKYDTNKDGLINQSELVRLCTDMNVKPWKAFKELDVEVGGEVNKKQFTRWWFAAMESKNAAPSSARKSPASPRSPRRAPGSARKARNVSKADRVAAAMAEVKRAMEKLEEAMQSEE